MFMGYAIGDSLQCIVRRHVVGIEEDDVAVICVSRDPSERRVSGNGQTAMVNRDNKLAKSLDVKGFHNLQRVIARSVVYKDNCFGTFVELTQKRLSQVVEVFGHVKPGNDDVKRGHA